MSIYILFAGGGKDTAARSGKLNVVATIFPAYDFVRQIAGDKVNLSMLISPGAESHSFEPSPRDIITINNSDIFIYTGGEMERWIDRILQSLDNDQRIILALMDTVDLLEEEMVDGMEAEDDEHHDHDHGHEQAHHDPNEDTDFDEHVWTSPRNAVLIVRAITELLSEADSANAAFYRRNAAAYTEELRKLDTSFKEVVAGARRHTIVFGDRFPFRYFANAYGLTYFAAFPGCSTQTDPSPATIAFLINKIREERLPAVFYIELSNERIANVLSEATGARKLLFHSTHNVSRQDFNSGLGYLELMQRNVENLRTALN